ncbi:hypothetical protein AYI68_g6708 [Smittium mucronatum]|uniref:Uncharacterized protein n=1 Tax=Smittium mucronatum TaxID=133383 RepID=A0A1R0GQQ4_9FUNG|nr:hypothetical protein AYI68_g6708 [Smittium mucronatum]
MSMQLSHERHAWNSEFLVSRPSNLLRQHKIIFLCDEIRENPPSRNDWNNRENLVWLPEDQYLDTGDI